MVMAKLLTTKAQDRGYREIFYIHQRYDFWPDPDSSDSHKENKKKIIKIGPLLAKWRQFSSQ